MSLDDTLAAFFADYASAWSRFDTDAVMAFMALPQIAVTADATHFYEAATELEDALDRAADDWQGRGVVRFEAELVRVEPLPDAAARADVHWRRLGADGQLLLEYTARYTLAEEAGRWAIVASDTAAEAAARIAAG